MDGLNEAIPRLTEEALKSMDQHNQEAAYRQQELAVESDQGQSVEQNQSTSQTGPTVPQDNKAKDAPDYSDIRARKEAGEDVTFAEGFTEDFGDASAANPLNLSLIHI